MQDKANNIKDYNYEKRLNKFKKILQDKKIRISHQRLLILDYLMTHPIHPTAENIFKDLKSEDPLISQATVYNSLNLFVKHKLVKELDFNMTSKRYEFRKPSHGHFICDICSEIEDVAIEDIDYEKNLGLYDINNVEVTFRGICPECQMTKTKDLS